MRPDLRDPATSDKLRIVRLLAFGTLVVAVVGALVGTQYLKRQSDIPLPFVRDTGSFLTGDLTKIGQKSGVDVVNVTFPPSSFSLADPVDYSTGNENPLPVSVAIGDLNGDGKPDLAVADRAVNLVSVFLNNGDGTFASKVDYPTGTDPQSIAIGDLNGDGKPDLALANNGGNTISVFLNNGNGTFVPKVDYPAGTGPYSVAIGDLNGDGKADLAVTNYVSNTVSVFLNNGDGTFASKVDDPTGTTPTSVAIGDLNGDGKPDLAVTNFVHSTVSVFLNNGDGTFAPKVDYSGIGIGPVSVAIGDLNGDGKPDLAVANLDNNFVSVFLNKGDGTFTSKADYTTGTRPNSVAIGDLNGDGKADLAVAYPLSNAVSIFLNTTVAGVNTQTLSEDKMYLVSVPNDSAVAGMPLDQAFSVGGVHATSFFGYKYTTPDATDEKAHRNDAAVTSRFPGQFFASQKARDEDAQHGNAISGFESANHLTMAPTDTTDGAKLASNSLYFIIVNEPNGALFRIRPDAAAVCGNGVIEGSETCDDGNTTNGDGCNDSCAVETGYSCSGTPSVCTKNPVCGNGVIEGNEACDDGNTANGDGCSATCTVESGYTCTTNSPSLCKPTTCGNGTIDAGEQCDDGANNGATGDPCDNKCQLVTPTPGF